MADEPKLLPIDLEYIIQRVRSLIDEAENDYEEAYSSTDELINIGKKEAFTLVIQLLYALKKRYSNHATHSDGKKSPLSILLENKIGGPWDDEQLEE